MRKILSILLTVVFLGISGLLFPSSNALDYKVNMSFDVVVKETKEAEVSQAVTVTNKSEDFLASSVTIKMPFDKVENLSVTSKGKTLPATIKDGQLWIEFRDKSLDRGESKDLEIKYTIPKLVEDLDQVKRIVWPKFTIEKEDVKYELRIIPPKDWLPLAYANLQPKASIELKNSEVLAFSEVDKELDLYLGEFTLKNARVGIEKDNLKNRIGELSFPHRDDLNFLASNDAILNIKEATGTETRLNLEPYLNTPGITLLARPGFDFEPDTTMNGYFEDTDEIKGTDTVNVETLYDILLSRFTPETNIGQWERHSVSEIIDQKKQDDLDYANSLVALYRSKSIPANIVYGMALYPDGNYYWHFWVVYQKAVDNQVSWYEADPYLEDLTGKDYFTSVPPTRLMWDMLPANSDLSELSRDIFVLQIKNMSFKKFDTNTAESGYILSQVNKSQFSSEEDSVLGLSDFNNNLLSNIVLGTVMLAMTAFLLTLAYFLHKKFQD